MNFVHPSIINICLHSSNDYRAFVQRSKCWHEFSDLILMYSSWNSGSFLLLLLLFIYSLILLPTKNYANGVKWIKIASEHIKIQIYIIKKNDSIDTMIMTFEKSRKLKYRKTTNQTHIRIRTATLTAVCQDAASFIIWAIWVG